MIRIAVCDDERAAGQQILQLVDHYGDIRKETIETKLFSSPFELLGDLERGSQFDVLLLDVLMPGENGIETAREIRRFDAGVKIIFLTSSSEHAVDSYTVHAFHYLLKPAQEKTLYPVLDDVLEVWRREQSSILLRCRSGLVRVQPRQIELCEVLHRDISIHLRSGQVLESTGSLQQLEEILEETGAFFRVHRSYLVNLDHVRALSFRTLTLVSGLEVPVPRGRYEAVKNAFLLRHLQDAP